MGCVELLTFKWKCDGGCGKTELQENVPYSTAPSGWKNRVLESGKRTCHGWSTPKTGVFCPECNEKLQLKERQEQEERVGAIRAKLAKSKTAQKE